MNINISLSISKKSGPQGSFSATKYNPSLYCLIDVKTTFYTSTYFTAQSTLKQHSIRPPILPLNRR